MIQEGILALGGSRRCADGMRSGIADSSAQPFSRAGESDLPTLMADYQQGDRGAMDTLVRRIAPLLLRYFASGTASHQDAEDLVQECWIRIHKSRHTYRTSEPLLPWIFAIARYTRLDEFRRRRRRLSRETLVATTPEVAVAPAPLAPEDSGNVARLLQQLPESQREVILMLKVSGMSLEEVAGATSSTVGAIKQKAHRAYARLREMMEKDGN